MTKTPCWRCGRTIAVDARGTGTISLKCRHCKAINRVHLDTGVSVAG